MFRQTIRYGTGLIALYIIVAHGSEFGQVIAAGAEGGSKLTRTFQGRG